MEVRVDNKVLLVTGAAQGLGRAVALEAARSGAAAIILTDRNTQRGDEVVSEILKLGAKAALVAADLEEQDAPARIISAAIDQFGRLDGLVNAAGLSDRGSVAEADTALFDHLFAVNNSAGFGPYVVSEHARADVSDARFATPSQGTQGTRFDRQYLVVPGAWSRG